MNRSLALLMAAAAAAALGASPAAAWTYGRWVGLPGHSSDASCLRASEGVGAGPLLTAGATANDPLLAYAPSLTGR